MAVAAKIKFVQGMSDPPAGEALIGVAAVEVVVTNQNNSNVETYEWEMVDAPPGSSVSTGIMASGGVSTVSFTPDLPGGYILRLTVLDLAGNKATDFRVFQIVEASGYLIPPFTATANALNFSGQTRGWAKYLEEMLRYLLLGGGGGGGVPDQFTYELTFLAAIESTDSSSFTRVAGRRVTADATRYPSSVTGLTKTMYFEGTVEVSNPATSVEIKLVTAGGTDVTDSLFSSVSVIPESFSLLVPYGTSSGEIRTDYAFDYEVHVRLIGGSPGDVAIISAAQLVIRYS